MRPDASENSQINPSTIVRAARAAGSQPISPVWLPGTLQNRYSPRWFRSHPGNVGLAHMLQRTFPAGFIAPCLPTKTTKLPSGSQWLHEIKHDGFRVIARKHGPRVRLYSRPGNDMTRRFPLIAEALTGLRSRSCIIDGEAVVCDDEGLASFERIRYRQHDGDVFLYAFDLIELYGDDLRRDPLQVRKATLASGWPRPALACASTSISKATARPSSPMPARWGSKASCRSGRTRLIVPGARLTGLITERNGNSHERNR